MFLARLGLGRAPLRRPVGDRSMDGGLAPRGDLMTNAARVSDLRRLGQIELRKSSQAARQFCITSKSCRFPAGFGF